MTLRNHLSEANNSYSSVRLNPPQEGSQGEAPQWVLYSYLWRVCKQIAVNGFSIPDIFSNTKTDSNNMDKYQILRDAGIEAGNYDLDTEGIIKQLTLWDAKYNIAISNVAADAVDVAFKELPEDLTELALEIYEFCPDTIDQHFGCIADAIEIMEGSHQDIFADMQELIKDVDLTDENYGFELLKRSLSINKAIALWWD